MNIPLEVIFLPFFLAASSFFSGFETGIISINRHRLLHLVRGGSRRAAYIARLLADPQRLLATTLVGNNISNVVLATLAANLGFRIAGTTGQALAAPITTVVILVFGEYLPKIWLAAYPLRGVLPLAFVFRAVDFILYPVAAACAFLTQRLTSRLQTNRSPFVARENVNIPARENRPAPTDGVDVALDREGLKILARDSQRQGHISPFERHLINRVLELQLKHAWQLMTPLDQVISVTPEQTLADCRLLALQARHDRLPVFAANTEPPHCLGILQLSDVNTRQAALDTPVARLMRPARVVDMNMPADDLLPFMRANHQGMILLKDHGNRLRGVITQEDLLTALIDDLRDPSTDRVPDPA